MVELLSSRNVFGIKHGFNFPMQAEEGQFFKTEHSYLLAPINPHYSEFLRLCQIRFLDMEGQRRIFKVHLFLTWMAFL